MEVNKRAVVSSGQRQPPNGGRAAAFHVIMPKEVSRNWKADENLPNPQPLLPGPHNLPKQLPLIQSTWEVGTTGTYNIDNLRTPGDLN